MTRDQRLALALGIGVVLLGALAVAQRVGLGSGYSTLPPPPQTEAAPSLAALDREQVALRPYVDYGEMLARPIFNETRAPELQETAVVDPNAPAAQPLNLQLAGIILAGEVKLAMVTDPGNGETQRVRLGQPLEGPQSAWTLVELKPRTAVFDGAGLGRTELELTVDTKGMVGVAPLAAAAVAVPAQPAGGPPPTTALSSNTPVPADPNAGAAAATNAEEIRRRIEDRRRQLREEAQRMSEQQNQNQNQ